MQGLAQRRDLLAELSRQQRGSFILAVSVPFWHLVGGLARSSWPAGGLEV